MKASHCCGWILNLILLRGEASFNQPNWQVIKETHSDKKAIRCLQCLTDLRQHNTTSASSQPQHSITVLWLDNKCSCPSRDSREAFIHCQFPETSTFPALRRFPTPRKRSEWDFQKSKATALFYYFHITTESSWRLPQRSTAHGVRSKGTCCTMGSKLLLCGLRSAG